MIALQLVLVVSIVLIVVVAVRSRQSQRTRAFKKLSFMLIGVVAIVAILVPDLVQWFAESLGVGRGTDLVLYMTVVALFYVSFDLYMHLQDAEQRIVDLAREVTLLNADDPSEGGPPSDAVNPQRPSAGKTSPEPPLSDAT